MPANSISRPPLPMEHLNPHIKSLTPQTIPAVKFQEIVRDDQSTIVARMKVPTPQGHAFILRRLDTGAVSLTTMFRAAFPTASDEAERQESAWAKAKYDLSGTNRAGKARFAGTWVTPAVAMTIGEEYTLTTVLQPLAAAVPDPDAEYRKSSRAQQAAGTTTATSPEKNARQQLPTPAPSLNATQPTPAKRPRRESSAAPTPIPALRTTTTPNMPSPRRSTRTTSPAQLPAPRTVVVKQKSPLKPRSKNFEPLTPGGSDETAVDEDVPDVPGPNPDQDIAEQRALIANLKEQRDAQKMEQDDVVAGKSGAMKRGIDEAEAPLKFDFKEPETEQRVIATNKRVRLIEMTPERKSAAWGTMAFAAVFGLLAFAPNPWF